MKSSKRMPILLTFATVLVVLAIRYSIATTPGIHGPNAVSSLEKVNIGGVNQWLLIRGRDTSKPVLLCVHGGPGFSEMAFSRQLNGDLEKDFIVVNWDQRGSGKSFSKKIDKSSMTSEQLLMDTHDVTEYLKKRFGKEKIFLMGHSWGSYLGLKTVCDNPEDFYAYIGIGQLINGKKGEALSLEWTKRMAINNKNKKAVSELDSLSFVDGVYKNGMEEKHIERKWLWHYKGFLFNKSKDELYLRLVPATEYTIADKINYLRGVDFSEVNIGDEWQQKLEFDTEIKSIKVPVFFIQGKYDYNAPSELVKEFCDNVQAPLKEYIEFENSAHSPNFEEPERFNEEMDRIAKLFEL